jgi:hypothetical protein
VCHNFTKTVVKRILLNKLREREGAIKFFFLTIYNNNEINLYVKKIISFDITPERASHKKHRQC